jgi:CheY-like chemotaxis protein
MARILLVDDDPTLLVVLSDFLKSAGHEVFTAPDPISFASRVKVIKPDIVIMDFQMPAGGAAAAQRTLDSTPELQKLPILFCTGVPMAEVKKVFPESPLRRYVSKPVHLGAFKDKLEMLLAEALRGG